MPFSVSPSGALSSAAPTLGRAEKAFASEPAREIVKTTAAAMRALSSAHIVGTQMSQGLTVSIDMSMTAHQTCTGTLSAGGGTAQIRGIGSRAWFKADDEFWRVLVPGPDGPGAEAAAGGRWTTWPATAGPLGESCDLAELTAKIGTGDPSDYASGAVSEVGGQDVVAVENTKKHSTAYIETASPHRILLTQRTGGPHPATVGYTGFNLPVDVQAPSNVFNLDGYLAADA
jgi:hypothetical protein